MNKRKCIETENVCFEEAQREASLRIKEYAKKLQHINSGVTKGA
jgi:hypothetical protein